MNNKDRSLTASISVVIPFYNGKEYWAELVGSLRGQTSKLDEAVIVLDGEDQYLPEIDLDGIAHQVRIIKLDQNKGVANARNIGIDAVESEYIFFLDQDDYFYPTRVAEVRKILEKKAPDWVVNNYKMVSNNGDTINIIKPRRWLQSMKKRKRLENQFMYKKGGARISAICCRKNIISKFDQRVGSCDDFVFIFHLLETGPPCLLDMCGNARRYHDNNNSQNIKHRQSQIKSNVLMQRKYKFSTIVRKKSISNLCCELAIESMVYRGDKHALRNFSRAYTLYPLNAKALLGFTICKTSKNPVMLFNGIKTVLSVLKLTKAKRLVGS